MSKTTLIDCRRNTLIGKYHKYIRNYSNSAKYCIQSDSSECEILCQKSLPCVSTPADFILVFRTLLNRLDCIILLNCYRNIPGWSECGILENEAEKESTVLLTCGLLQIFSIYNICRETDKNAVLSKK